jgi:hypothetical protein
MTSCGSCNACCVNLRIKDVFGRVKPAGVRCPHQLEANPAGCCSVYSRRPVRCSEFHCGYLFDDLDIEFRPDKCGVMYMLQDVEWAARESWVIVEIEKGALETGFGASFVDDIRRRAKEAEKLLVIWRK